MKEKPLLLQFHSWENEGTKNVKIIEIVRNSMNLNPQANHCVKISPRDVFDGALYWGNYSRHIGMDKDSCTEPHFLHTGEWYNFLMSLFASLFVLIWFQVLFKSGICIWRSCCWLLRVDLLILFPVLLQIYLDSHSLCYALQKSGLRLCYGAEWTQLTEYVLVTF